jgi:hypothetical protein
MMIIRSFSKGCCCLIPPQKAPTLLAQALFAYEDATKEAGTIGQVLKVGYTLNKTRSLRPAQVGTIKAP